MSTTKYKGKSIIVTATAAKDRSAKCPNLIVYNNIVQVRFDFLLYETARRAFGCRVTCHSATSRGTPGAYIYINIIYAPFSARHEFIYVHIYHIYIYRNTFKLCLSAQQCVVYKLCQRVSESLSEAPPTCASHACTSHIIVLYGLFISLGAAAGVIIIS